MHENYLKSDPVVIDPARLQWALEMHQVNVRLNAEAAGNITSEQKKRRWWQRKGEADTDHHRIRELNL